METIMSDIYETFDFGYDPSVPETIVCQDVPPPTSLPSSARIDRKWLPPVGKQHVPNCFVWSTTYGIATVWAAQKGGYSPTSATDQGAPDYTYIQVEEATDVKQNTCVGGGFNPVFQFLMAGGTATLANAPNLVGSSSEVTCEDNWTAYGPNSQPVQRDARFQVPGHKCIPLAGEQGLANMRAIIASGQPLAYCTHLYTDFPSYKGDPPTYIGNGQWLCNKRTHKRAGHCMMVIGYDDDRVYPHVPGDSVGLKGAVLIQNSFGTQWGADGLVWMAYTTFQTMAEGSATYISAS
jgi:Papain family cysteine protease